MVKKKIESSQYDILIIDDSKSIIKLITDIIASKGFSCKAARNLPEAMDALNACIPKLILLDVNMPDLNGYKFCMMLKEEEKFSNILVYYLTGTSQSEIGIKTLETKADGYITKPFNLFDFNDVFDYMNKDKN